MKPTIGIDPGKGMATVRLAYVHSYRDRHGKHRHYYRRKGQRFALPGRPGEAQFMAAYEAAAANYTNDQAARPSNSNDRTFDTLAVAYFQSPAFIALRPSTKTTYRGIIDRCREAHGSKRIAHLERRHIAELIAEAMRDRGPHAANNLLKVLRVLLRLAVEIEWRVDDPTQGVRPVRAKTEGFTTWSEDDIAAFEKRWEMGSRELLAMALLLYTGQRRGDVVRMGRQHIQGDIIRVVQSKTGASLAIPIHARLREVLSEMPTNNLTFLMTVQGRGFSPAGFGNWFRETCDKAGLTGRSAHGLRKAAARRLAEAGCSASQIGAITGHKTLKEVSRYTAAADQARMARDAIKLLQK